MTGARRPLFVWLSLVGVFLGLTVLAIRVAALPDSAMANFFVVLGLGLLVSGAFFGAFILILLRRMRAAARAFPTAVTIPVTVGLESAAGSRWLADRLGDDALVLPPNRYAVVAVDAAGLHVVTRAGGPFGLVPASAVGAVGEARTLVGARELDALEFTVTVGDETAPLRLVPMRLHGNPLRPLETAERHALVARVEAALRGEPVEPGWPH